MGKGTLSPEQQQKLLNKQYREERNRLNKYKRSVFEKGYNVTQFYQLPKIPKVVTKADVEELSAITKADIYNRMEVTSTFTGEIKTYTEVKEIEEKVGQGALREFKDKYQERGYIYARDLYEYHPPTEANGVADIPIIENIRGRLASIPSVQLVQPSARTRGDKWYYVENEERIESIVGLFDDVLAYQFNYDEEAFSQHLMNIDEQLSEEIDKITGKYKTEADVDASFIRIMSLLTGGDMSLADREYISNIQ